MDQSETDGAVRECKTEVNSNGLTQTKRQSIELMFKISI